MESSICSRSVGFQSSTSLLHNIRPIVTGHSNSAINLICKSGQNHLMLNPSRVIKKRRIAAIGDALQAAADPAQAEVTWQIVVGALAGVTPFVVAGIEFSKRIMAQRRCEVCKGSGLVLRDNKYYFRCPRCGGFLPWQSWKRFFSG